MRISRKRKEILTILKANEFNSTVKSIKREMGVNMDSINEDHKVRSCLRGMLKAGLVYRYQDEDSHPAFMWQRSIQGRTYTP